MFGSKRVKFGVFLLGLLFFQAKAMQNSFCVFEELVYLMCGFRFPVSQIPISGFKGCPVADLGGSGGSIEPPKAKQPTSKTCKNIK